MKTSVVLLALATAALAAPALHEDTLEDEHHIPTKFLDAFTRERKSTLESSSSPSPGSPVNFPSQVSEFGVSGRSFNLKKPIIIKKKVGSSYQVYRSSDEEKLDTSEPCRKQVRVNLCDEHSGAKSADMIRSSTIEDPSVKMTENEMKQSIMLAKEAVENLQKDLRKVEQIPVKTSHWKHGDTESDVELHQDIEVARQALEHIHNNFGILETSNSQDITEKEAENVEDVALPLAHTEEERLTQWKEAIENIQRNVELVRNIEDSFKSTHDDTMHTETAVTPMKDINQHELQRHSTKDDITVTENVKKESNPTIEHLEHSKLEKTSDQNEMTTDIVQKDMLESASMVSASKRQELNDDDKARFIPEELKNQHITKNVMAKDALDSEKHLVEMNSDHLHQSSDTKSLKVAEEEKQRSLQTEHLDKTDKLEEPSLKKMKSIDMEESLLENQRDADKEHFNTAHKTLKHDEHAKNVKETEDIEIKTDKHITGKQSELIQNVDKVQEGHHITQQMKEAGNFANVADDKKQFETHESMVQKDHSFVEGKMALNDNSMMPASHSMADDHHKTSGHTSEMKAAEETNNKQHQLFDQSHMRWAQDKNFNTEMGLMKSAAETHQAMDHMKQMHPGHHHIHHHANPHHLDTSSHGHMRHHDHFMNGKSADMDNMQSNYYMNMRESDNLGQEGHRFRWRPSHTHESARTAYGAPAPASPPATGAVGLFPNANVGGCGIPLLLSCNPSVVSGSLAKAHPASYSAPAYRTEDDFNFHSKRDVKKTDLVNKLRRTSTNPILKSNTVLVAKQ